MRVYIFTLLWIVMENGNGLGTNGQQLFAPKPLTAQGHPSPKRISTSLPPVSQNALPVLGPYLVQEGF